jgi:glycosyltransferase involved in cell wall biosynthesis
MPFTSEQPQPEASIDDDHSRDNRRPYKVCVVGSGTRFLSGISYYTNRLAIVLATRFDTSVVLMRQLIPTRLYPGGSRVGRPLSRIAYPPTMPVFDGVDWFWLPTIFRAGVFLFRQRPDVVVFQWWTGAVLHTYLFLAVVARLIGARVVVEFHEVQDVGEMTVPYAERYVTAGLPQLLRLCAGMVVHSEHDRAAIEERYGQGGQLVLIPHGPYDKVAGPGADVVNRDDGVCRLLYFGVIRPFKGVEDLVRAFDGFDDDVVRHFHLTVVGETWEGWTLPAELIARSRHRNHITFINRYVSDDELAHHVASADAMVLPYHRSSASGPLHVAMGHGLPVVVTSVGGLVEAAADYPGTVFVPPADPAALRLAIMAVAAQRGPRYADPHSWDQSADGYEKLLSAILPAHPELGGRQR